MNRKVLFIIIPLFLLFFCASNIFAQKLPPFKAEISFINTSSTTISIFHIPIERVSVNMRTLVATGTVILAGDSVELSDAGDAIMIQYFTDDDTTVRNSSTTYQIISSNASSGSVYGFITDPILITGASENIHYRIVAKAQDGTIGRYPPDDSFIETNLKQMKSQYIDVDGGNMILQSGDQRRGNTLKHFSSGALLSAANFRIKELYTNETLPYVGSLRPIIAYEFTPSDLIVNRNLMPTISLYYGDLPTNMNSIEVRWLNGTTWERVNFSNDIDMRTVTINLALTNTKLGYYAIFDAVALNDNDYRPEHRVFVLGDKLKFRNLQAGDSVTIFDINGRQVKRLTSPSFEWDGRVNSGAFAESGSYIYQIKINGKIISGSIAFVR